MPYFKCIFINDKGNYEKRIIFGPDKSSVSKNLSSSNKKLLTIKRSIYSDLSTKRFSSNRIKYSEFLMFNQKLIILLKAGVSFIKALTIIINNHRPCALKDILIKAENDINNGVSISEAFFIGSKFNFCFINNPIKARILFVPPAKFFIVCCTCCKGNVCSSKKNF